MAKKQTTTVLHYSSEAAVPNFITIIMEEAVVVGPELVMTQER
jgi:hypothetical protein